MNCIDSGAAMLAAINEGDVPKTLAAITEFRTAMCNPEYGASFVEWIGAPPNLVSIQTALTEKLNIHPRAMAIRRMAVSRARRSDMLIRAMEAAIKRAYP